MLDSLYEEALKKRGKIIAEIEEFNSLDIDIADYWNFKYVEPSNEDIKIAAGDGSYSHKKFLAFNLYAVAALAIIYDGKNLEENLVWVYSLRRLYLHNEFDLFLDHIHRLNKYNRHIL